jgi:hypothetical protein
MSNDNFDGFDGSQTGRTKAEKKGRKIPISLSLSLSPFLLTSPAGLRVSSGTKSISLLFQMQKQAHTNIYLIQPTREQQQGAHQATRVLEYS